MTTQANTSPIILGFSGGLDTSFCVPWMKEHYGRPVVTVTINTGGIDAAAARDLEDARPGARRPGARAGGSAPDLLRARAQVPDLRQRPARAPVPAVRGRRARHPGDAAGGIGQGSAAVPPWPMAAPPRAMTRSASRWRCAPSARGWKCWRRCATRPSSAPSNSSIWRSAVFPVPVRGCAYSINRGLWGVTIGGRETLDSRESIPESAWVLSANAFERNLAGHAPHAGASPRACRLRSTASPWTR